MSAWAPATPEGLIDDERPSSEETHLESQCNLSFHSRKRRRKRWGQRKRREKGPRGREGDGYDGEEEKEQEAAVFDLIPCWLALLHCDEISGITQNDHTFISEAP